MCMHNGCFGPLVRSPTTTLRPGSMRRGIIRQIFILSKRNLRIATFYSGRAPLNRPSWPPDPREKAGRSRQPWLPRLPGDMQHHDGGDGASRKAATGAATVAQAAASPAPPCCMATPDRRRARSGLAPRHDHPTPRSPDDSLRAVLRSRRMVRLRSRSVPLDHHRAAASRAAASPGKPRHRDARHAPCPPWRSVPRRRPAPI
jgi:hypothetical protein